MPEDLNPWRTIGFRLLLVTILLLCLTVILWLDREGLQDHADNHISFSDVVYFAMVTITTVGYGDIVPITPRARMIDAFVITPLRAFVWVMFFGTAYQLALKQFTEGYRMAKLKASLEHHTIVCGVGHTGLAAIKELLAKGTNPEQILAIDIRDERVRAAVELGIVAIRGDATHEAALQDAAVQKAKALIISTGRDDTNTLILLTVRQLHTDIRILVSAKESENVKLLKQAGANTIITPASFGGCMLAASVDSHHLAQYLQDLITAGGRIDLIEERVQAQDVGKTAGDLLPDVLLRVYRRGHIISLRDLQGDERLNEGDMVLLLRQPANHD
ncbi:MAG: potassium channel family protein [Nitrospirota bacterium]|nr:potassium channel family protein [Nitrospirota bacterium]